MGRRPSVPGTLPSPRPILSLLHYLQTRVSHVNSKSPTCADIGADLPAITEATVQDKLAEHGRDIYELRDEHEVLKDRVASAEAKDKTRNKEIADLKALVKTIAASRYSEIVTGPSRDPEMQVMWLQEEILSLREENSQLVTAKSEQYLQNVELRNKIAQLISKLDSVTEEQDNTIEKAVPGSDGKAQHQHPAPQAQGSGSHACPAASQSLRRPVQGLSSKEEYEELDFKLMVAVKDKKRDEFTMYSTKLCSQRAFPRGLADIEKKARSMAAKRIISRMDVHILLERDPNVDGKRWVFANDPRYANWIKHINSERSKIGDAAAAKKLRGIKVCIFESNDAASMDFVRSIAVF